jgi:hypothetical protein
LLLQKFRVLPSNSTLMRLPSLGNRAKIRHSAGGRKRAFRTSSYRSTPYISLIIRYSDLVVLNGRLQLFFSTYDLCY